jgi:hypothetical protein
VPAEAGAAQEVAEPRVTQSVLRCVKDSSGRIRLLQPASLR